MKAAVRPAPWSPTDAREIAEIPLGGDFEFLEPLPDFNGNGNGNVAIRNGEWLIVVHTELGKLYRVDPQTGIAAEIDLDGAAVPSGDGLALNGRTLYVVQNFVNQIGVVHLGRDLTDIGDALADGSGEPVAARRRTLGSWCRPRAGRHEPAYRVRA